MGDTPSSSENVPSTNGDAETQNIPTSPSPTGGASHEGSPRSDETLHFDSRDDAGERSSTEHLSSESFGDYVIVSEIARGGMGVVYKAEQKTLNRQVALKMILAGQLASEQEVRRFYTEAQAAATLDHPNIVPVYDVGEQAGTHFFSMKLIEGSDLARDMGRIREDLPKAVELLEKACRAVHHAHQRGILHRDLKPANVLIDQADEPYVTDLGLARSTESQSNLTRTGVVVGTPSYMSPEQAAGKADVTTATDIYALGAILYEILTGKPPFKGDSPMDTLLQVIHEQPSRPSASGVIDRGLEMIALQCLAKDATQRYATAELLADDLRRWINGEPLAIRGPSVLSVARNWMQQNFGRTGGWIVGVGVLSGLISGLALWNGTIQTEYAQVRDVYSKFTSVDPPFTAMQWNTPIWLAVPSMLVFALTIAFSGYFAAWLVKTRNRSADIAAGLTVGVIAAAVAFVVCIASITVVQTIDDTDLDLLVELGTKTEATSTKLAETYPELLGLERDEQISLLRRKIYVDRISNVPYALRLATFSCFVLYVCSCLAETVVAGPILRRQQSWWRSLLTYFFCSIPFATITLIFGVHWMAFMLFGNHGIIWGTSTLVAVAVMVAAVVAELRKWANPIRIPLLIATAAVFLWFFVARIPPIPTVAVCRVRIANAIRAANRHPEKASFRLKAANAFQSAGVRMYRAKHYSVAEKIFVRGIEYIRNTPAELRNYDLDRLLTIGYANRANALKELGRGSEVYGLFIDSIKENPASNVQLLTRAANFFVDVGDFASLRRMADGIEVRDGVSWRVFRTLISNSVSRDSDKYDDDEWLLEAMKRHLQKSSLSPELKSRLTTALSAQSWLITYTADSEQRAELQAQLLAANATEIRSFEGVTWTQTTNVSPRSIDLTKLFPDAPAECAAFAIGFVRVDEEKEVQLYVGSDDGFELWLNGRQIAEDSTQRSYSPRQNNVTCVLKPGVNIVALRIDQVGGDWAFGVQFEEADGWPASVQWNR